MTNETIRDAGKAFESAIRAGVLSDHPRTPRFAGHFMYMYTKAGRDYFKNIDNRDYLTALVTTR